MGVVHLCSVMRFSVDTMVSHKVFGEGVVSSVESNNSLKVEFVVYDEKTDAVQGKIIHQVAACDVEEIAVPPEHSEVCDFSNRKK